uniref:Uncharacterized protein n=1 Tax=Rhipicephalus zambeziensis TaxID=60191 RepID=A0A224YT02_9ACAR
MLSEFLCKMSVTYLFVFHFLAVCVCALADLPRLLFFLSASDTANVCCAGHRHAPRKRWSFLHEKNRCVSPTLVFPRAVFSPSQTNKKKS